MRSGFEGDLLLAIDQGTTSTRAMVFDTKGNVAARAQEELAQSFPNSGWVEHDAVEIFRAAVSVARKAMQAVGGVQRIAALGITNQRETTILWDRKTGVPLHPAIVWQDRRTARFCEDLRAQGRQEIVRQKSGLLLDPYFSASKLAWLLDHIPDARSRAKRGELAFGTVDSWLIWQFTKGQAHATDATNAARTMLFNIESQQWDEELLSIFDIPAELLPEVKDCADDYGDTASDIFGASLPIRGVAGDQHAAMVGQACFEPGMIKATFGTGCFVLVNTGSQKITSANHLLTTPALRLRGKTDYALEGSVFTAGSVVQWLRDGLKLFRHASETEGLAVSARDNAGVWFVPAFTGLGAPYWDPHARGAILGLTRDTGAADIVRAALEAVAFQTRDLLEAMAADMAASGLKPRLALRADGGMVSNDWFMQCLADILGQSVERAKTAETTALGAAYLAALGAGLYSHVNEVADIWQADRSFDPKMSADERNARYEGWKKAVARVLESASNK